MLCTKSDYKVTLLDRSMKDWFVELYNKNLKELGDESCYKRIPYDNTLVLLENGVPVSCVTFSVSMKEKEFRELNSLTPIELRKRGYAKTLLKAFAEIVGNIPEFKDCASCRVLCLLSNVEGLKYHRRTADFVKNTTYDGEEMALFSKKVAELRKLNTLDYTIDDVVYDRFLTRVMCFKVREGGRS